jgi:uncharacterized protein (TIGR02246 family)
MNNDPATTQIKDLLERQVKAIGERNIAEVTKNYDADVVIFDVVGPLAHPKGVQAVTDRLRDWFDTFAEGAPIDFSTVEISISAGENIAFSRAFNHISAPLKTGKSLNMFWRETLGWEKKAGTWKIVHAHSSVPFDATNGQASTGLKP